MTPVETGSILSPMSDQVDGEANVRSSFESAREWLRDNEGAILEEQIEIARCPAPPFKEQERGRLIAGKLETSGLEFRFDDIGNLLGWNSAARGPGGPVVVAAHLDTVFGPDVPIRIRQDGDRWIGPGVSDNARGIAIVLAVARALARTEAPLPFPLVLAFTVGEEGAGDLRGVKHLFRDGGPLRDARAFVAVDGGGLKRIISQALGSRRYRITVRGPGGHSWTNWGRVNPAVALGRFVARTAEIDLPDDPRTTLTAARLGAGTSINAIPQEGWVELDLRSEAADRLDWAEGRLREALEASLDEECAARDGSLEVDWHLIGERPAGRTELGHELIEACHRATREHGVEPKAAAASTDANVPMSLGIPSVALGGGGRSGETHTEHEWFQDTDGAVGALRLLDVIAAIAGA